MSATEARPVSYRPIERHWYRVADFVQPIWHRFAGSLVGRFTIWFVSCALWTVVRVATKIVLAAVVVGAGVLYMALSMALGNGKLMNSGWRSGR